MYDLKDEKLLSKIIHKSLHYAEHQEDVDIIIRFAFDRLALNDPFKLLNNMLYKFRNCMAFHK